jgi:hypothetical protein
MIRTRARGQTEVAFLAVGRHHFVAQIVDHFGPGNQAVNPQGVDLGNDAQHHAQPITVSQCHQAVVIVKAKLSRLGFRPAPQHPELNGIEPRFRHRPEVLFPVLLIREWGTVVL